MTYGKSFTHIAGHIAYIVLYGLLVSVSILFYNSANLVVVLFIGWVALAFGVVFCCGRADPVRWCLPRLVEKLLLKVGRMLLFATRILGSHGDNRGIGPNSTKLGQLGYWCNPNCLTMFCNDRRGRKKHKKFGDAYKEYMKKVPRISLLSGIIKRRRGGR